VADESEEMINRLKHVDPDPQDEEPAQDFWEITGKFDVFYVDRPTAERVLGELGRLIPPRRIRFVDLFGAKVSVPSREVGSVMESKSGQRASLRRFERARRDERKAERRPWEDDD
jgi:hypothetical protein